MRSITASMLYDYVLCPHRVTMDVYGDDSKRDSVSPFVQLLWKRGFAHENEVIIGLGFHFLDLSGEKDAERERLTMDAMKRGEPLIYSGRISIGNLVGIPDFLRKEGSGCVAGDIKSGSGEDGSDDDEERKPKKHYAVQVALYTDILERLGMSAGRRAFILDINGEEVHYDLSASYGVRNPRTLWQDYEDTLTSIRAILVENKTLPAYSSTCKNCVWYSACLERLEHDNDLTLIPFLGRALRDTIAAQIGNVQALSVINPDEFIAEKGKKTVFAGLGPDRLRKFQARAKLLVTRDAKPYLTSPVAFPVSERELFFDIEVDPMRDICYLHGFIKRLGGNNGTEEFVSFFADRPTHDDEKKAFVGAWNYIRDQASCTIYYHSKYERTIYRKLRSRYPDVCTETELEAIFDPVKSIDLYFDVVLKATEWPTRDFSIKTLAKHLGFAWRDTHPSGAASIEWFHRWTETRDEAIKQRILDYNEDDCRATRVLLDGIRAMAI